MPVKVYGLDDRPQKQKILEFDPKTGRKKRRHKFTITHYGDCLRLQSDNVEKGKWFLQMDHGIIHIGYRHRHHIASHHIVSMPYDVWWEIMEWYLPRRLEFTPTTSKARGYGGEEQEGPGSGSSPGG